jgi:Predicted esterase of the alpha-beta hydrolase superfamily
MPKFALCLQGGGSRGTYCAGPIEVLMENDLWADFVIGTSCGGLMACNYVAKQPHRAIEQTLFMCDDKIFFRPFDIFSKKRTMFNYEHLVNEIGHNEIPFSFDVFAQNPCKFYVVSTNALTGEVAYIEKSEPHFLPDAVAASGALPLTTYPVMFGGIPYLDGGVVCPIGFNKASEEGYEKIVVLATREKGFRKTHIKKSQLSLVNHMYKDYPNFLKVYENSVDIYNSQMDSLDRLADEGKIFVIYPSRAPKVKHSETDKKILTDLMSMGRNDALEALPQLKTYLSK